MKKVKKYLLSIYIMLNMLTILVCSYLIVKKYFNMWRLSKLYIGLFILNTIIFVIMLIFKAKKKRAINFRITDIYLLFIILFGILSTIFAHDVNSALFGFNGRYEGLFSILYYLSLFMLSSFIEKDQKKVVVYILLFCGVVESIYAILQVTQLLPVVTQYNKRKPWATGFITNPNFFGSLTLLCLCYSIGLFIDENKKKKKTIFIMLVFLFMVSLLLSNSLSVIVGLISVLIYLLIYTIKKKKFKKLCLCILVLLSTFIIISRFNNTTLVHDIAKTSKQTIEITKGHIEPNYGSNRILIWEKTIKEVPYYLPTGVGIDNFYYAFGKRPITIGRWFFDKAHNEYLQILICEGIFALISYLLFFGTITIRGIKNSFKNNELYLLIPIIGYLVQAFFNISVIEVAPFFYIALGLLVNREEKYQRKK